MDDRGVGLLIRGGRIVDPSTDYDEVGDLLVENGVVRARGHNLGDSAGARQILAANGQIVCPGFVDLHTHLRYPGFPAKETIATGTAAAAAGGFTTVCAMANTDPVVDTVDVLLHVLDVIQRDARVRVRQLAAVTKGLRGEQMTDLKQLSTAGAMAFSDDGKPVWNTEVMHAALIEARRLGKAVSVHEEDPATVGHGVANAGPVARRLGLKEWPCSGEASMVERDVALLKGTGGHLHVAHVSCAETIAVIRSAKESGLHVTAEATPHHLRLTDRLLEGDAGLGLPPSHPCTKVNPPLRSETDVEALVQALADGTIDAIATDHAPHTVEDKKLPYHEAAFGFSALETALPLVLGLVRDGFLSLTTLIERLTCAPARVFGLDAGSLRPGSAADICIFDPVAGWCPDVEGLQSRGKNTPLMRAQLTGRVTCTIVGGAIVHRLEPYFGAGL